MCFNLSVIYLSFSESNSVESIEAMEFVEYFFE